MVRSSRPVWGAWIEIKGTKKSISSIRTSRPVWGAWIEIKAVMDAEGDVTKVAPRMGRVD